MDVYRVAPLSAPIDATIEVPGSKSVANRALVCAALAEGETVLRGVPDGDDTEAMLDCLRALGLEAERAGDDVRIAGGVRSFRRGPVTLPAR
ncbi:MAG: bifunctional 3-phosphoshikimate 1-carboxyvinyltransferase/cytidylate kinase, partial [Actinobacteria bacterium]|nr:bifunctional 3-phosphoshikimate 1-carboxyvinyltransferase/cytidylate kinase [Actinomycetota bacterium]